MLPALRWLLPICPLPEVRSRGCLRHHSTPATGLLAARTPCRPQGLCTRCPSAQSAPALAVAHLLPVFAHMGPSRGDLPARTSCSAACAALRLPTALTVIEAPSAPPGDRLPWTPECEATATDLSVEVTASSRPQSRHPADGHRPLSRSGTISRCVLSLLVT